jgi:cyclin-A
MKCRGFQISTPFTSFHRKYEEIYPPDVAEFVYITDDTYTKTQVLRMEQLILKVLSFDLCIPSSLSFISLYKVMNDIPEKIKFLAMVR